MKQDNGDVRVAYARLVEAVLEQGEKIDRMEKMLQDVLGQGKWQAASLTSTAELERRELERRRARAEQPSTDRFAAPSDQ
jgi:hypothetical protein